MMGNCRRRRAKKFAMLARKNFAHLGAGNPAGALEFLRVDANLVALRRKYEAHHQRRGERPGLAGDVLCKRGVADDASFLEQLARSGLLNRFARFAEAGEAGHETSWPEFLAADEGLAVFLRQHDRNRIGAREMFGAASGALRLPACIGDAVASAALGAEGVR